jgi:hypothetical protein
LPRDRIASAHAQLALLAGLLPLEPLLSALFAPQAAPAALLEARTLDAAVTLHPRGALRTVLVWSGAPD